MTDKQLIAFSMPTYGTVPPEAAVHFATMFAATLQSGADAIINATIQPAIDRARNDLVERALSAGASHIMWVDSDVVCPPNAVVRMLAHGLPVVSGLYHYKVPPFNPVVFNLRPVFSHKLDIDLNALQEVDGVGMGCVLIETSVYRKMAKPWYTMGPVIGEDVGFFMKLKDMGVSVALDADVRCGHIRNQMISTADWLNARAN